MRQWKPWQSKEAAQAAVLVLSAVGLASFGVGLAAGVTVELIALRQRPHSIMT